VTLYKNIAARGRAMDAVASWTFSRALISLCTTICANVDRSMTYLYALQDTCTTAAPSAADSSSITHDKSSTMMQKGMRAPRSCKLTGAFDANAIAPADPIVCVLEQNWEPHRRENIT